MRIALQIILVLSIFASDPALADVPVPCRDVKAEWVCGGTTPVLRMRGPTQMQMTISATDGPLKGKIFRLKNGQKDVSVPALQSPMNIALLGEGGPSGNACCFGTKVIAPPAPELCNQDETEPDTADPIIPPVPLPNEALDTGVILALDAECPEGAAANICGGSLSFSKSGPDDPIILPLSLTATFPITDIRMASPFTCFSVTPTSLFCQIPRRAIGETMALPITLQAGPVYDPAQATLCAQLAGPTDPNAAIRLVQTALTQLGFDPGPIDGQIGAKTRAATTAFSAQYGIETQDPLSPAFLSLLGLNAVKDSDPSNDQSCATTLVAATDPPGCDASTAVFKDGACACRYARMRTNRDGLSCSCVAGTRFIPNEGCIKTPRNTGGTPIIKDDSPPLKCDPASTVKRGDTCVCRYKGMIRLSPSLCLCRNGERPTGGGCP